MAVILSTDESPSLSTMKRFLLVCSLLLSLLWFSTSIISGTKSTAQMVSFRSSFPHSTLRTANSSPLSVQKLLFARKRNLRCNLASFIDHQHNESKILFNPMEELRCLCELLFVRADQARKTRGNDFVFPHRFSLEVQQRNDYFVCLGLHTSGSIAQIFPHPDAKSRHVHFLAPVSNLLFDHKTKSGISRHNAVHSYFQKVMNQLNSNSNINNIKGKAAVFFLSVHDAAHMSVGMAEELWAMKAPLMSWNVHRKHANTSIMFPDLYFLESGGYVKAKQQRERQMQKMELEKEKEKEKELQNGERKRNKQTQKGMQKRRKEMQALGEFDELINKVMWRGSSTGFDDRAVNETNMFDLPRAKLCLKARDIPDILDAKMTQFVQVQSYVAKHYSQAGLAATGMSPDEMNRYRGQIDIDGNANAWNGCFQKLLSPSITLKVAGEFEQWYYGKLEAWEHYVPVREDMEDLKEKVQWVVSNDEDVEISRFDGLRGGTGDSVVSGKSETSNKVNVMEWKRSITAKSTEFVMSLTIASAVEETAHLIADYFFEASKHPIVIGSGSVVE